MVCYACGDLLSDAEIMANPEDLFIQNKCLCKVDLAISNQLINDEQTEFKQKNK